MRTTVKTLVLSSLLLSFVVFAKPLNKEMSDAEYTKKAHSAAPKAVADGAKVVRVMDDGSMKTIRDGGNGFTCMVMGTDKMCNDANSMEFIHALMRKEPPPDKVGMSYMLAGDEGASNTDPYSRATTYASAIASTCTI